MLPNQRRWAALAMWVGTYLHNADMSIWGQVSPALFVGGTNDTLLATALAMKQIVFWYWLSLVDPKQRASYTKFLARKTKYLLALIGQGKSVDAISSDDAISIAYDWAMESETVKSQPPIEKTFRKFLEEAVWRDINDEWHEIFLLNDDIPQEDQQSPAETQAAKKIMEENQLANQVRDVCTNW